MKKGLETLLRKTRPVEVDSHLWIANQAEWLANAIWAIAPERPIWESALEKAEKRAKELMPKEKLAIEMLRAAYQHSQKTPQLTPRPVYSGARSHMKRQGRPVPLANPVQPPEGTSALPLGEDPQGEIDEGSKVNIIAYSPIGTVY